MGASSGVASAQRNEAARTSAAEDTDEDEAERAMIIRKCLASGLDDDQITEIVKQHMYQKMQARMEGQQERPSGRRPGSSSSRASESSHRPRRSESSSAKRQAKAAKQDMT